MWQDLVLDQLQKKIFHSMPFVQIEFLCKWNEWPPIGKIAAHSAYNMFSWYKYLIVNSVLSHLGFWSGNLFLIVPFPDRYILVPFQKFLFIRT